MILNKNTVFDYKTHRENFPYYLEAVILKDGHIEYAVPSHQLKLVDIYAREHNCKSEKEVWNIVPIAESPNDWLIYHLGVISVWYNFIVRPMNTTKEQEETLKRLVEEECINPNYREQFVYKKPNYEWVCKKEIMD